MGILHRGSSEVLCPIMLIKKSYSGSLLGSLPEYRLVVDFKYLNSHLPDVKFSYPEVKHILHKIGRSSAKIYSVLYFKAAFHSINLSVLPHAVPHLDHPPTNRTVFQWDSSRARQFGLPGWGTYCQNYLTISVSVSNV